MAPEQAAGGPLLRRRVGIASSLMICLGMALLLIVAVCLPCAHALIERLSVRHDTRSAFHIASFGYERGGVFQLTVHDLDRLVPAGAQAKDQYETAFVLQRSASDAPTRISTSASTNGPATTEVLSKVTSYPASGSAGSVDAAEPVVELKKFVILDDCFHRVQVAPEDIVLQLGAEKTSWKNFTYQHVIDTPGYMHLYFSNCEIATSVSWTIELLEYNLNADGNPMYLNAGERYLPTLLLVLAALFVVELVAWTVYLRRHGEFVRTIHWLMLACVFIKAVSLAMEALKYSSLKAHGVHDSWFYISYGVGILKSMFLFCVIVLLSTGWSYLKPHLTERDRYILLATLVVQACVNVAVVVVGELQQGDSAWSTVHDILSVLDMLCWCMILVPIVWSIRSLRDGADAASSKDDVGSAGRSVHRLQAFRSFYLLVIAFIYFTRIVVFLLALTLPFELVWLSSLFSESAALVFYGATGFLFRPATSNPYLALEAQDDEMQGLQDDEDRELDAMEATAQQQTAPQGM